MFEGASKGNLAIDKSMDYYGKKNIAIEIRNYDILNKSRTSGGSGWIIIDDIIDDKDKFEYIGLTIPNSYKGCTYSWFKEPNELENANPILDKSCFFETPQKINIKGETYSNPYTNVTTNKSVKVELSVSDQKDPVYQEFVKGIVNVGDKTLWIDVEQVDISCITPTN